MSQQINLYNPALLPKPTSSPAQGAGRARCALVLALLVSAWTCVERIAAWRRRASKRNCA